jgi:hypothetical protein
MRRGPSEARGAELASAAVRWCRTAWPLLGLLACTSVQPEPDDDGSASALPVAPLPPSPTEVCRHLETLRRRATVGLPVRSDALDTCIDTLTRTRAKLQGTLLDTATKRDRCMLEATNQRALVDCSIGSFGMGTDSETPAPVVEAWTNLGPMLVALERYFYAVDQDGRPRYRCPGLEVGETIVGPTPALEVPCQSVGGCQAVAKPTKPGEYPAKAWSEDPTWSALGFAISDVHRFHYALRIGAKSAGRCQFTAQAFGDLDNDRVWSTYEIAGALDELGPHEAAGMYIDRSDE